MLRAENGRRWVRALVAVPLLVACAAPPVAEVSVDSLPTELPYAHEAEVALEWLPRVPRDALGAMPTTNLRLVDPQGSIVWATEEPLDTRLWRSGKPLGQTLRLAQNHLAGPLPSGRFRLEVALHEPGAEAYGIAARAETAAVSAVELGEIETGRSEAEITVDLEGDWQAASGETGARWMGSTGTVVVRPAEERFRLSLELEIPALVEGWRRTDTHSGPALALDNRCGVSAVVGYLGRQRIDLVIRPHRRNLCRVLLSPGTSWVSADGEVRSLLLRSVSVTPLGLRRGEAEAVAGEESEGDEHDVEMDEDGDGDE